MIRNTKLKILSTTLFLLSSPACFTAEAPESLESQIRHAYTLKESITQMEGNDEIGLATAKLKATFLDLGCRLQASPSTTDQELAPLFFIEAAKLMRINNDVPDRSVQGSLSDAADYNFGTMDAFLSQADNGQKYRVVFAFDGGGIRGVIPALYAELIEQVTHKRMCDLGDLFAGTSVGGIIASGLNYPKPFEAAELVKLFSKRGEEIFPQHNGFWGKITAPLRYIAELFVYSRYNPAPFEKLLMDYFGDAWIHDSLKPLYVTTIQTTNRDKAAEEYYFSSLLAKKSHGENYRFRDVNRATSAATTYFPAANISSYDSTPRRFIDAGLTVNNPAEYGYKQARKLFPGEKILVVSFGTGKPINLTAIPANSGAARSAKALISNMMDINSETTHWSFVDGLQPGDGYVRVQCLLDKDIDLDNVSKENLAYLSEKANTKKAEIMKIAEFLARNTAQK